MLVAFVEKGAGLEADILASVVSLLPPEVKDQLPQEVSPSSFPLDPALSVTVLARLDFGLRQSGLHPPDKLLHSNGSSAVYLCNLVARILFVQSRSQQRGCLFAIHKPLGSKTCDK